MSRRLYPHRTVKYWYTYDVEDVCALFRKSGLRAQTVRAWVKNGLKTIDKGKPALIYGYDLIEYLKHQNSKHKCKTAFNEIFCFKCKDARPVFQRKVTIQHKEKRLFVSGQCRDCKTLMFKPYKMEDLSKIKSAFHVVDVLELYDCEDSSCKTHIQTHNVTPLSESEYGTSYGDLFQ